MSRFRCGTTLLVLLVGATLLPSSALAKNPNSRYLTVRVVNIPTSTLPKGFAAYDRGKGSPMLVDSKGRVYLEFSNSGDCCVIARRYDAQTGRFLRGYMEVGRQSPLFRGAGSRVWYLSMDMGCTWFDRGIFQKPWFRGATGPRLFRITGEHQAAQYNSLAVAKSGRVWSAGWSDRNRASCGYYPEPPKAVQPGLPGTPRGRAAIFRTVDHASALRRIYAPAAGPLTGVAVSGHKVWAYDPFRFCSGSGTARRCHLPMLLRYDTRTGRFRQHPVPRADLISSTNQYITNTPMAAAGKSVWTAELQHHSWRYLRFHHGHFTVYRVKHGTGDLLVRGHSVWIKCRHAIENPVTGGKLYIRPRKGWLLQDPSGHFWYVRTDKLDARWPLPSD